MQVIIVKVVSSKTFILLFFPFNHSQSVTSHTIIHEYSPQVPFYFLPPSGSKSLTLLFRSSKSLYANYNVRADHPKHTDCVIYIVCFCQSPDIQSILVSFCDGCKRTSASVFRFLHLIFCRQRSSNSSKFTFFCATTPAVYLRFSAFQTFCCANVV